MNPLNDSDVNGNTIAWMADKERENKKEYQPCSSCDCETDHQCINCGDSISPSECKNTDGYCYHCAETEIIGMKFGGI